MGNGKSFPIRVLLVEDNSTHAYVIERNLKKAGEGMVVLETVPRLELALNRLDVGDVDALLLDLSLPDSQIHETLPRVIETHSEVPIIVLTSLKDMEFATRAVRQGAQDFLVKSDLNGALLFRSINYAIERKKLREQLEVYAAELESSNEQLKSFAHTVAHEIKSPLTVVTACLHVLEQHYRGRLADEDWEFVEDAGVAVRGLTAIVNDLLEFSCMGPERMSFEEIDMEAVYYHAYVCLRPAIKEANAAITHDPLPVVRGNEVQLRQLLVNLIGNAIKYGESAPAEVHVSAEESGKDWTFSVRDNGLGIAAEDQVRIFEAFVRVHDQKRIQGSGVGLALCQQIIRNHAGRIWVESVPGKGSTFYFTLPRAS